MDVCSPVTVAGPHRHHTGFRLRRPQISCRANLPDSSPTRKRVHEFGLSRRAIALQFSTQLGTLVGIAREQCVDGRDVACQLHDLDR